MRPAAQMLILFLNMTGAYPDASFLPIASFTDAGTRALTSPPLVATSLTIVDER